MIDFPLIPVVNSGTLSDVGMGYASEGWHTLLHSTMRLGTRPTVGEWADRFGCLHIHNPFGLYEPMQLDQYGMSLRRAFQLPTSETGRNQLRYVSNRLNLVEFVAACKDFPHRLSVYDGSPMWLKPTPGESQANWLLRFLKIIDPYIAAGVKEIGFDNYMGDRPSYAEHWKGKNGLIADAFKAVRSLGIEVGIEPFNYAACEWLHKTTKWITEQFLAVMQARDWASRKVDEGQAIQIPGSLNDRWVIIAKLAGTDQEKIDHLNELKQNNPTAEIAAYAAELPVELLN
mgnify:CR=1 FL=1